MEAPPIAGCVLHKIHGPVLCCRISKDKATNVLVCSMGPADEGPSSPEAQDVVPITGVKQVLTVFHVACLMKACT